MEGSSPLNVALVGAGRMGRAHLSALQASSAVRVAAIVDPALTRSRFALRDYDAVTADHGIDALLIAAPTAVHDDLVGHALDRGKHVLAEKPLTLDPLRDHALAALARRKGLILQIGFWRRFCEPFRLMRRLLADGAVGVPRFMRAQQWDSVLPSPAFCDPLSSGGLEIDCGVHEFDLARWLLGAEIETVQAMAPAPLDELIDVGDVDSAIAIARLSNGVPLAVDLARTAGYCDTIRCELVGSQGAIVTEIARRARTTVRSPSGKVTVHFHGPRALENALLAQVDAFSEAIRSQTLHVDAADGDAAAAALIAASAMLRARSIVPAG